MAQSNLGKINLGKFNLNGGAEPASGAIVVGTGSLVLTGKTPTAALGPLTVPVGLGSLLLTGFTPTLFKSDIIPVGVGSLVLTGKTPSAFQVTLTQPGTGSLVLTAFTPVANVQVEPLVCSDVTPHASNKAIEWKDEPTESLGT
jgi:hypothetical protein